MKFFFFKSGLRNILPITTAKVPIVKFEHRRSGLEGDISLYNTLVSFTVCKDPGMFTVVILKVYRSLTVPLCLKLTNVVSIGKKKFYQSS